MGEFFNFERAMKKLLHLLLCLIPFGGCSTDSSQAPESSSGYEFFEDFVEIQSVGTIVELGTNDPSASLKDRPAMKVLMEQNFFMGRHEVTCGEFNKSMKNVSGLQVKCEEDNLPATNVTLYDAILYANALSKAAHYDTVYSYSRMVPDVQGNCINLEGLVFHPEKEGFRLPTEAEWVYVASQNWNPSVEWLSDNSTGKAHAVCSYEGAVEICDMVGNVKEWVNDWMSPFRDSTISNYVGASDGSVLGERVLKGGYFLKDSSMVNLYGRSDIYTVTSGTKTDYVGFRLAFGAITDAVWVNSNGSLESTPVVPLVNSSTMKSLTGTFKVKLAFRNDNTGNLVYVDYSQASAVVEISDTMEVFHPEISPDGNRVAFCTGLEGVAGKSALYVRNLDAEGSGLVKLDVESAAIPRWRVIGSDTVIIYVSDAGSNKNDAEFLQKSTWMVPFAAGSFGTPVKLLDGAFHGGVDVGLSLAVSGSSLLRTKQNPAGGSLLEMPVDAVWYGGEQACNVSLSEDGTKRVAFLDFGGAMGAAFAGERYNAHEYLLISDSVGNLINMVHAPAGFTFDHTEWVSGVVQRAGTMYSKYVTATLTNVNGAHSKIVLVDIESGDVVDLVEGGELWHPSVWVRSSISDNGGNQINYDSAGVYFVEGGADNAKRLRYRMEYFWKYRDSMELIGLGSSRMSNGFDPPYLHAAEHPVNMGFFQSGFLDIYEFYRNYVRKNVKNLKYVVFSLDLDIWFYSDDGNFFYTEYMNYPGFVYDANHDYWRNADCSAISEATKEGMEIPNHREMFGTNRSSLFNEKVGWGGDNLVFEQDSGWMDVMSFRFERTYSLFMDFLKMTAEDSLVVIGVIFPQAPGYRNMGTFGRHGLRRSEAMQMISEIDGLRSVYPHFVLMDENKMGYHDYTDDMAQDADHLAPLGAKHFTERLDSLIQTLKPLR